MPCLQQLYNKKTSLRPGVCLSFRPYRLLHSVLYRSCAASILALWDMRPILKPCLLNFFNVLQNLQHGTKARHRSIQRFLEPFTSLLRLIRWPAAVIKHLIKELLVIVDTYYCLQGNIIYYKAISQFQLMYAL